ncbi:ATP-dependent acyl-CoA ligase [Lentzea tibetensis]|uniref:ATP-dependent acyl-CoA ligase n=1 Tax=Lentzea tibetensis TaxID=2591470 RepID=A0A563ETF2_9PSEU|nr:AMP-binding protein [Lentzea tibetensis]TWP50933.1 ATP-dependent acyl-CoA ligase [Lentzea tibetensis]
MADLATVVQRAAARWPDRPAWTFDRTFTFADVDRLTAGYAQALRLKGIQAGDRVAVLLCNVPEFPLTWLALARLGAAMVPVNVKYRTHDTEHLLRTSGAKAIVTTEEFRPLLEQVPSTPPVFYDLAPADGFAQEPVPAEATANIQFTSGTTGSPKGCVLSHTYWTTLGGSLLTEFPHLTSDDVMLTAQPFHYIDPQWNVIAALMAGAHLVVLDGFHPSTFWDSVRSHGVTYFYCLGAMPTLLLRMPEGPLDREHRVRAVQCSAIPPQLHEMLEDRWGVGWYEAFGMTETGADIRVGADDHDELVGTGCLGRPAAHREARVVDGELQLRGPGMMDGYLGHEPVDGWFATGDLARIDDDGRVYHLGRRKDMIRRGGENVAAHEVEEVLLSHPLVTLAAVVGVPDEIRGEEVKAFVVSTATEDELTAYCADRLASFKVPRFWEFRDDLPRTASERVAKHLLAES